MAKTILQLSNDFPDQKIYVNLVNRLSNFGYNQIVYVPVKWEDKIDGNRDESIKNVEYHYSYILKRSLLFRLQYHKKINIILQDLESKVDLREVDLIHGHFLFSDGGVAYKIKKKYNIPYVVSVRASDIFTFFKWMFHLRKFGNKIMNEAERVIFINPSYVEIFKEKYLSKFHSDILNKISVVPNAIDDKWFSNLVVQKRIVEPIRLLYVGRIVKRKKLDVVINALKELNKKSKKKYVLEVVGDGNFIHTVKKMADNNVIFHGHIYNFSKLLEIYKRSQIFVMPSIKETFGLVYVEALSQGLPIVFCKGEGVDGFFKENEVGVSVRNDSVNDVIRAVDYIEKEYEQLTQNTLQQSEKFNWDECTKSFIEIYERSFY
ncbi:glycosyltransferase family 4 protein [Cellulophaga omnivescoria]|uniref:glycosyltransferase family 4 protein n=1 Tax=Cellulophaga omnivescoria TaxID=1888890 RepID=UPI000985665E|nr:glycosyltransferase family 4 protein [Cellulophaga omnivescoria]WBU90699.1 glycosyltransferase family 4 protein [Cellulophaga omnivescoria]